MAIITRLDYMLAKRKMRLKDLSELTGISKQNLSLLKNSGSVGIKWKTLNDLCKHLKCSPGELIEYSEGD